MTADALKFTLRASSVNGTRPSCGSSTSTAQSVESRFSVIAAVYRQQLGTNASRPCYFPSNAGLCTSNLGGPAGDRAGSPVGPESVRPRLANDANVGVTINHLNGARFLALAVLWGSAFTLIKIALEGLTPSQLVLARLGLGAAVLVAVAAVRKVRLPRPGRVWVHLVAAAILSNVVPFTLQAHGEQTVAASYASVLLATIPLFTLTIATAALPNERPTSRKAVGLVLGFFGVLLVVSPWRDALGSITGTFACLGAALSVGFGFVYARKYLSPLGLAPLALAASQLTAAALVQVGAALTSDWRSPELTGRVALSTVFLGLVGTGVAYVLYFGLIGDIGATAASAVSYVVPVFGVVVSVPLLGERVTWNLVGGGLIVLAGMAYAEDRLKQVRRRRPLADRDAHERLTRP